MSHSRNFRVYFALVLLLVSAVVVLLREHRPSFLRPNLHMYAYVSSPDGAITTIDLARLQPVNRLNAGAAISDFREHTKRNEIWGAAGNFIFVLETPSNQITRIPIGNSPLSID